MDVRVGRSQAVQHDAETLNRVLCDQCDTLTLLSARGLYLDKGIECI